MYRNTKTNEELTTIGMWLYWQLHDEKFKSFTDWLDHVVTIGLFKEI